MIEARAQHEILAAWGAHPRVRIHRNNTGLFFTRTGRGVRAGVVGAPDIEGIIAPYGRYIGIEVKSPTGRQRPEQVAYQRMTEAMGGIYILARSVADVDAALAAFDPTLRRAAADGIP